MAHWLCHRFSSKTATSVILVALAVGSLFDVAESFSLQIWNTRTSPKLAGGQLHTKSVLNFDAWQSTTALKDANRWEREIEENSRKRAASKSGAGETVAGAVLGGLLLGPFGALFGASLGSGLGRQNAVNEARQREMERLGLSPDMLDAAKEIGQALQRNMEGLKAVQESYDTQRRFAQRLDADAQELYSKAKKAIEDSDDVAARKFLFQRENVQSKLKEVLKTCATARQQVQRMEENTRILEQQAFEVDALLRRTVGAKAVQDSSDLGMSLSVSDPLLDKFRDLGIQ